MYISTSVSVAIIYRDFNKLAHALAGAAKS